MLRSGSFRGPHARGPDPVSRPGIFEADWPSPPPPPADPPAVVVDANGVVHHAHPLGGPDPQSRWAASRDWTVDASESAAAVEAEWAAFTSPTLAAPASSALASDANHEHGSGPAVVEDDMGPRDRRRRPSPRFRPAPLIPVKDWDPKQAVGSHINLDPVALVEKKADTPSSRHQANGSNAKAAGSINGTTPNGFHHHPSSSSLAEALSSRAAATGRRPNTNANANKPNGVSKLPTGGQPSRSSPALPASALSSNMSSAPKQPHGTAADTPRSRLPPRPRHPPMGSGPPRARPSNQRVLLVLPAALREATADVVQLTQLARQTYNDPTLSAQDLDIQYAWLPPPPPPSADTDAAAAPTESKEKDKEKPVTVKVSSDPTNHRLRVPFLLPHLSDTTLATTLMAHLPPTIPLASYSVWPAAPTKRNPHVHAKALVLGFHTAFQVKAAYTWLRDKCPAALDALFLPAPTVGKHEIHWLTPRPRSLTPVGTPAAPPVVDPAPLPAVTLANIDAEAHKADVLDVLFGNHPPDMRPLRVERLAMPATDPPTLALRFAFASPKLVGRFVRALARGAHEGEYVEVTAPGCQLAVVKVEGWEAGEEERDAEEDKRGEQERGTEEDKQRQKERDDEREGRSKQQDDVQGGEQVNPMDEETKQHQVPCEQSEVVCDNHPYMGESRGRTGTGGTWVGREVGVV